MQGTSQPVALDPSAKDFVPDGEDNRFYVRLRYGHEYSGGGGWVVSSPRNLMGVDYELHDACLARSPVAAINKLSQAGFKPCDFPPQAPRLSDVYTDKWVIMMYTDNPPWLSTWQRQTSSSSSSLVVSPGSVRLGPPTSPPMMPLPEAALIAGAAGGDAALLPQPMPGPIAPPTMPPPSFGTGPSATSSAPPLPGAVASAGVHHHLGFSNIAL